MKKQATRPTSVDEYIAGFPKTIQLRLNKIRKAILKAAPMAEEKISYNIPGYLYQGILIYFAAFENHISVYPAPRSSPSFKKELAAYKGGKGTVQFPHTQPIPFSLITDIVKFRLQQNIEKGSKKKTNAITTKKKNVINQTDKEMVKAYLDKLSPSVKSAVNSLRKIIKSTDSRIAERIKWNAPSYYCTKDLFTFGPIKNNTILLVFHHPGIVKIKSPILEGAYKDRRLAYFTGIISALVELSVN